MSNVGGNEPLVDAEALKNPDTAKRCVKTTIEMLQSPNVFMKRLGADGLARLAVASIGKNAIPLPLTDAIPPLTAVLEEDAPVQVRAMAALALGTIKGIAVGDMATLTIGIEKGQPGLLERLADDVTASKESRELARHALVGVQKDAQARYDAHDAFLRGLEGQSTRTANPLAGDGKLSEGLPKAPVKERILAGTGRKIPS